MAEFGLTVELLGRLEPIGALSVECRRGLAARLLCQSWPIGADPLADPARAGESVYLVEGELLLFLAGGGGKLLVGACEQARRPLGALAPVRSKAVTPVQVLRIDADLVDAMLAWEQVSAGSKAAGRAGEEATVWRTVTGALTTQALAGSGMARVTPANLREFVGRFQRQKVKAGQVVVREGEAGDFYYVIERGRAAVSRHVGGADVAVADLRAGDAFGEEALVSGGPRNATVTMATDGVLLRLAQPDFVELLQAPLLHAIGRAEAEARVAAGGACWLDVRYAAEFVEDGLPGAINVPLNEIRSAFEVLDPGREYIAYCRSGRRSSAAAFLLAQHGFRAVWLEGGLEGKGTDK